MTKKYELIDGRCRSLQKFGDVNIGDLGGFVSDEKNLAQSSGTAWVSGNARVSGNACVSGDARVYDDAMVSGDARVYDGEVK